MTTSVAIDKKLQRLQEMIRRSSRVLVAFSGGVDSTLLLKIAIDVLGRENVLAVTADSPSVPRHELAEAKKLTAQIGAEHLIVETQELDDPRYVRNPPDRCYYCRLDLFRKLNDLAKQRGYDAVLAGANADDLGDWRPGLKAAVQYGLSNPFADVGMTKNDIRRISREMGLPTHDKPAGPCLSTRVAYRIPITREVLARIESAEAFLRGYGLREFRVRHHGDLARIELPPDRIQEFTEPKRRAEVIQALCQLGYKYVTIDLQGYRSGSMNETVTKR